MTRWAKCGNRAIPFAQILAFIAIETLSGAIGITEAGIQAARGFAGNPFGEGPASLGNAPVLDSNGRAAVENALIQVKSRIQQLGIDYDQIEEMVIDVKTIEIQLMSQRPKTAVVKAVLAALSDAFTQAGAGDTATMIDQMIR